MNKRIPDGIDEQLRQFRKQQIASSGNRKDLYLNYDKSTIDTNLDSPETQEAFGSDSGQGFLSSLWHSAKQNISDLWNSINYDMDT